MFDLYDVWFIWEFILVKLKDLSWMLLYLDPLALTEEQNKSDIAARIPHQSISPRKLLYYVQGLNVF